MLNAIKMRDRNYISTSYSIFFNASDIHMAHSLKDRFFSVRI